MIQLDKAHYCTIFMKQKYGPSGVTYPIDEGEVGIELSTNDAGLALTLFSKNKDGKTRRSSKVIAEVNEDSEGNLNLEFYGERHHNRFRLLTILKFPPFDSDNDGDSDNKTPVPF